MAKKKATKRKTTARKKTASKGKQAIMKCPECKCSQKVKVPVTKCLDSFTCKDCGKKNKAKDCCCMCDYGKGKCPGCCSK